MRIALWGNFGTHNLGNECTLAAAVLNLRQRLPDAEVIAICSRPEDTGPRHDVRALPIATAANAPPTGGLRLIRRIGRECAEWMRAISHGATLDALIVTGTGVLTDTSEGALGLPYQLFKWAVAIRLCGGRVLLTSVGVEAIRRPLTKRLINRVLRLADYRSYRDARSALLLKSIGFNDRADEVVPDLAFSLPPPPCDDARTAGEPLGAHRRIVAVGLFNYRDRGAGTSEAARAYDGYLESIRSFIRWLLDHGYAVRVIVGDLIYDDGVRLDVRSRLEAEGVELASPLYSDEPAGSFQQLLEQLAGVDMVVASRYHNVLLALLARKPVISLSYEEKNDELMRQVGLGEFCQRLEELDVARLIGQFQALEARAESIREMLTVRIASARDRVTLQYDQIVRRIASRR